MLRVLRACNPALRRQSVQVLNKHDCTVVFWPTRDVPTPSHLRATLRMSMVKLSTLSFRRSKLSQTLVTPGNSGAEAGIRKMLSTLNSPELASGHDKKGTNKKGRPVS